MAQSNKGIPIIHGDQPLSLAKPQHDHNSSYNQDSQRFQKDEKSMDQSADEEKVNEENLSHKGNLTHWERWEDMFTRLVKFQQDNGHCMVPNRYSEDKQLGTWVATQRRCYKSFTSGKRRTSCMTPERAYRLTQIGFDWVGKKRFAELRWETQFKSLLEYVLENGHALVPVGWKLKAPLGNWVSNQRQEYKLFLKGKESNLTAERIKLLNSVGFIWEAPISGLGKVREELNKQHTNSKPLTDFQATASKLLKVLLSTAPAAPPAACQVLGTASQIDTSSNITNQVSGSTNATSQTLERSNVTNQVSGTNSTVAQVHSALKNAFEQASDKVNNTDQVSRKEFGARKAFGISHTSNNCLKNLANQYICSVNDADQVLGSAPAPDQTLSDTNFSDQVARVSNISEQRLGKTNISNEIVGGNNMLDQPINDCTRALDSARFTNHVSLATQTDSQAVATNTPSIPNRDQTSNEMGFVPQVTRQSMADNTSSYQCNQNGALLTNNHEQNPNLNILTLIQLGLTGLQQQLLAAPRGSTEMSMQQRPQPSPGAALQLATINPHMNAPAIIFQNQQQQPSVSIPLQLGVANQTPNLMTAFIPMQQQQNLQNLPVLQFGIINKAPNTSNSIFSAPAGQIYF